MNKFRVLDVYEKPGTDEKRSRIDDNGNLVTNVCRAGTVKIEHIDPGEVEYQHWKAAQAQFATVARSLEIRLISTDHFNFNDFVDALREGKILEVEIIE